MNVYLRINIVECEKLTVLDCTSKSFNVSTVSGSKVIVMPIESVMVQLELGRQEGALAN